MKLFLDTFLLLNKLSSNCEKAEPCFQLASSEVFFSFGTSAYYRISLTHNNKQAIDVFSLPHYALP